MVIRAAQGNEEGAHTWINDLPSLASQAKRCAEVFQSSTSSGQLPNQCDVIHALCQTLWTQAWDKFPDPLADPTNRFCVWSSLRNDNGHAFVATLTTTFAALKFCIRISMVYETRVKGAPIDRINSLKPWYTDMATASTFTTLCNYSRIAASVERSTPKDTFDFTWTEKEGATEFSFKGNKAKASDVRLMAAKLDAEVVSQWEEKVLLSLPLHVKTERLTEDVGDGTPGYCFIDDPRNNLPPPTALYDAILTDAELRSRFFVEVNGSYTWNHAAAAEWLADYAELNRLLLLRCEILAGGARRGTELVNMIYRSSSVQSRRNLSVLDPHVMLLATYSKTSSITGRDRFIPHSLDAITGDILLQSLILARPLAALLAGVLHPSDKEVQGLYTYSLFVNNARPFATDDITKSLKALSLSCLGFEAGVRIFRQLFIFLRRMWCPNASRILDSGFDDMISAEQAGHTVTLESAHYGLSQDSLTGLNEDTLPLMLAASVSWQKAMEVVPGTSAASHGRTMRIQLLHRRPSHLVPRSQGRLRRAGAKRPHRGA